MHDARGVCGGERAGDLNRSIERIDQLDWRSADSFAQRLTIDELRGDEVSRIRLIDFVDRNDVGMIER